MKRQGSTNNFGVLALYLCEGIHFRFEEFEASGRKCDTGIIDVEDIEKARKVWADYKSNSAVPIRTYIQSYRKVRRMYKDFRQNSKKED